MREAQRCQPRGGVRLVSHPVGSLLRRSAVISQAVRLDDQTQLGPVEVDSEPVHDALGLWHGKAGSARDWQEAALELGVGEDEGAAVKGLAEGRHASLPAQITEGCPQGLRIDQAARISLPYCPLEAPATQSRCEVNQGANRRGDRDAAVARHVLGTEGSPAVGDDSAAATPHRLWDRDFDYPMPFASDLPELRSAPVTQDGVGAAGEHRCHPTPVPGQLRSPNRVHPARERVKPADCHTVLYRLWVDAKIEQLTPRHDAVLALRKRPQPRPTPRLLISVAHGLPNASLGADSPPHPPRRPPFAWAMPT
jgi:hypothetical protein